MRYVHSNGTVQAKVWYSNKEKIELKQIKHEYTTNFEKKYSVRINNFQINFYKTLSKFEKYDTIEEIKKVKIFSDFYLPIDIQKKINNEYVETEVIYEVLEEIGAKEKIVF